MNIIKFIWKIADKQLFAQIAMWMDEHCMNNGIRWTIPNMKYNTAVAWTWLSHFPFHFHSVVHVWQGLSSLSLSIPYLGSRHGKLMYNCTIPGPWETTWLWKLKLQWEVRSENHHLPWSFHPRFAYLFFMFILYVCPL